MKIKEKVKWAALWEEINRRADWIYFWNCFFPVKLTVGVNEYNVVCPFHDDKHASMSVNTENGVWYCHGCGEKGNASQFLQKYKEMSKEDSVLELARIVGINIDNFIYREKQTKSIDKAIIRKFHNALKENDFALESIQKICGWTIETINKYQIGFDGERYTIPIFNEKGKCVNIRKYLPKVKDKLSKMLSYKAGYGEARLFPIENLAGNEILICEGEKDCILANQVGFNAITSTAGAGTWKINWNEKFKGKTVYICYDSDKAGIEGATKVASNLIGFAEIVKIVNIPLPEISGADFTDYIFGHGYTKDDFEQLIENSDIFEIKSIQRTKRKDIDEYNQTILSEASHSRFYDSGVELKVMVAGKDLTPYFVPKTIRYTCKFMNKGDKNCAYCKIKQENGNYVFNIESDNPDMLKLIGVNDNIKKKILSEIAGLPPKCYKYTEELTDVYNLEEIRLIPEIDFSSKEVRYVVRNAYSIGHGIETNKVYVMKGRTVADPRSQYATHLIREWRLAEGEIEKFNLTKKEAKKLEAFQPKNISLKEKANEIYSDYEYNVVNIYDRHDLFFFIDLIYHSVLSFDFQGERIMKGWTEGIIIGDTRTGKTKTIERIINHYKLGEKITGESLSFAGLVGGLQQISKRWQLQWGKIPLNDRRLLVIDEASGISINDIKQMSGLRSSGIAEITKIQTERTFARTRLIWVTNPRNERALMSYSQGVESIFDLIKSPEDIARFDMAMTCGIDEGDIRKINSMTNEKRKHIYTSELCNNLVLWSWSREPQHIYITKEAEEKIIKNAIIMGQRYHSSIPLVQATEQRIKIAKLSVACACRFFSTDENHEKVIVKPEHVKFVCDFLDMIYSKKSMSYRWYSIRKYKDENLDEEYIAGLCETIDERLAEQLLDLDKFRLNDYAAFLGDREKGRAFRSLLYNARAVKPVGSSYDRKTPAFIHWLRINFKESSDDECPF